MGGARRLPMLLVEDDEVDVLNVRRALAKAELGVALHVASDGVEALELLAGPRRDELEPFPKLVLLDLNLPRMNGIELLQRIRDDAELRRLVVIALTTSDDERDVRAAFDLNVAGYLVKPIAFPSFVEVMSSVGRYWGESLLP